MCVKKKQSKTNLRIRQKFKKLPKMFIKFLKFISKSKIQIECNLLAKSSKKVWKLKIHRKIKTRNEKIQNHLSDQKNIHSQTQNLQVKPYKKIPCVSCALSDEFYRRHFAQQCYIVETPQSQYCTVQIHRCFCHSNAIVVICDKVSFNSLCVKKLEIKLILENWKSSHVNLIASIVEKNGITKRHNLILMENYMHFQI